MVGHQNWINIVSNEESQFRWSGNGRPQNNLADTALNLVSLGGQGMVGHQNLTLSAPPWSPSLGGQGMVGHQNRSRVESSAVLS